MSGGGGFTNLLACDPNLSNQIAAFAPVSGAYYISAAGQCQPDTIAIPCNPSRRDIPVLEFHGANDETIPYAGGKRRGECLPSIEHWAQEWSMRNGFESQNVTTTEYEDNVQVSSFGNGLVMQYRIQGMVHEVCFFIFIFYLDVIDRSNNLWTIRSFFVIRRES